jgi:hypothetical protein
MRTLRLFIIVLALMGLLIGCTGVEGPVDFVRGSGNVITEDRQLSGFTSVTLQGAGRLEIDQTGSDSVTITADDNLMQYIETRVQGSELIISNSEGIAFSDISELVYHVTVETIDRLELEGAGDIVVTNLDGEEWQTILDGGGNITVSGKVTRQEVEINGLGAYNAENLECEEATVQQDGAGSVVVWVSEKLDVTINGVGSVEYIGDPEVTQTVNGLGTITKR